MQYRISTRFVLWLALILLPGVLSAQEYGSISGKITDQQSGAPLIGATVLLSGTSFGAVTDVDGAYMISAVPVGSYHVIGKFLGYDPISLNGIKVVVHKATTLNLHLRVAHSQSLDEVVVVSAYRKASVNGLYAAQKSALGITDGIAADQIRQSPDRHTGDVLQRVSGTSIQDHKFVIIRGLSERYNVTEMNSVVMPSTEPDKKAFAFDLIPSDLISRIVINKTATPDLPGDAAGGTVKIETKDFPDQKFITLSLATGYNTLSTGRPFSTGRSGGRLDFLGLDDGSRSLPKSFDHVRAAYPAMSAASKAEISRQFPNTFGDRNAGKTLPPLGIQFSMGKAKVFENGNKLGYIGALNYNLSELVLRGDQADFLITKEPLYTYHDIRYVTSVTSGALLNFSYAFGRNKLTWKNFFSNEFNTTFVNRTGRQIDGTNNITQIISQNDEATGNGLFNTVVGGEHLFAFSRIRMNWNLSYGRSFRNQPDQRMLTFYQKGPEAPFYLRLSNENSPAIKDAGRVYSKLHENIFSGNVDFSMPFKIGDVTQTFQFGGVMTHRDRRFSAVALGYASYFDSLGRGATIFLEDGITPANLFSPPNLDRYKIILANIAQNSKDYHGTADLKAGYLMLDHQLGTSWRFVWGVRMESYDQKLIALNQPVQDYHHIDWLPSANLTWNMTGKASWRLAYSRTVNRPEFRELAAFRYYDYAYNFIVSGNPNLRRSLNDNADVRASYYPSDGELLSASLFYKNFRNPIEQTNEGNGVLAYNNADNAMDYGLELDVRKKLDFSGVPAWMKHLVLFANASFIKGSVTFNGKHTARPLQGQSPYLVNGGMSYGGRNDGYSVSVLYNRIGPRLKFRGENEGLDTYEKPRDVLDFQLSKKIMKRAAELRLTVSDILSQSMVLYYKYPSGKNEVAEDKVISTFRQGTGISISFRYNFAAAK